MKSQLVAFEPFGSIEGVLRGEPIKIMPLGTFYRGKRKIEITAEDLKQIASNIKVGLPRFRIPINENHAGVGKIGTVYEAEFNQSGNDGPGLYATRYELTPAGKRIVEDGRFDAVSPEMIWKKNGAQYQDPQTGKEHDNVLVGLALTDRPFFGHDHVALFSESPEVESMADTQDKKPLMQRFKDMMAQMIKMMEDEEQGENMPQKMNVEELIKIDGFKDYDAETRREFAKKGWAMPDGSYPIADGGDLADAIHALGRGKNNPHGSIKAHIIKRAKALGLADKLPPDWAGSTKEPMSDPKKGAEHMSDNPSQAETFTVSAEEFAALKAKAEKVDELTTQAEQFKTRLDETQTQLKTTQRARDLDRMIAHADNFTAISVKADELGEKLLQLQEASPELFKWVDDLLVTLDKQLTQSELFGQFSSDRVDESAETFEGLIDQVLKEKFNGDNDHYADAMKIAEQRRPDLAKAYVRGG